MTIEEREFLLNDSVLRVPTPKQTSENWTKIQDFSPTTLMLVRVIGDMECKRMLRILLDSGGTYTLSTKKQFLKVPRSYPYQTQNPRPLPLVISHPRKRFESEISISQNRINPRNIMVALLKSLTVQIALRTSSLVETSYMKWALYSISNTNESKWTAKSSQ